MRAQIGNDDDDDDDNDAGEDPGPGAAPDRVHQAQPHRQQRGDGPITGSAQLHFLRTFIFLPFMEFYQLFYKL